MKLTATINIKNNYNVNPLIIFGIFALSLAGCGPGADKTTQEYLTAAAGYYESGKFNEAFIELKNALTADPASIDGRLLLGQTYLKLVDPARATNEFLRARELGSVSKDLQPLIALSLTQDGKHAEALAEIGEDLDNTTPEGRALLAIRGKALLGLGRFDEAVVSFKSVLGKDEHHLEALAGLAEAQLIRADFDKADDYIARGLAIDPKHPRFLSLHAENLLSQGHHEEASTVFKRAVNLAPMQSHAQIGLVRSLLLLGDLDQANHHLESLRDPAGKTPLALTLKSYVALEKKDFQTANTLAEQVLAYETNNEFALLMAGFSSYFLSHNESAYRHLGRYLAQVPGNLTARKVFAATQLRMGKEKQAYRTLSEIPGLEGDSSALDDAGFLALFSTAAGLAGNREISARYLERYLSKVPDNSVAKSRLGSLKIALGETEEGILALEEALAENPSLKATELELVLAYAKEGKFDLALTTAQQLQSRYPNEVTGYTLEGVLHFAKKDRAAAMASFRKAVEISPSSPGAALNLANLEKAQGNMDSAARTLDNLLQHRPNQLKALLTLADIELKRNRPQAAEDRLQQAVSGNPEALLPRLALGILYSHTGRPSEALLVTEPALAANPQDPRLREIIARAQLSTGQYSEAVKSLTVLQQLRPGIVEPHFYAAQALEYLGKSQQAIEALGQVLDIDANHRPARLALTRLLIRTLRPEQARAEWSRLNQSLSGEDLDLIELDGALLLLENNPKNAVAAYQKALELDPSKDRLIKLANAQWLTGQRAATITTLVGGLRNLPDDPDLRIQLADRYAAMGDFDKAVEHYRLGVGLLPDAAALRNNYARTLMETGQLENALVEARKAYELDPSAPEIQNTLGTLLFATGDQYRGLSLLRKSVEANPGNLSLGYYLAVALAKKGQDEEAREILEQILAGGQLFQQRVAAKRLLADLAG